MRTMTPTGVIEPLSQTSLNLADHGEDIRGWKVYDRTGQEFGQVADEFIDPVERHTRLVSIKSLGLGGKKYLVPVEVISARDDRVVVNETAQRITQGPELKDELDLGGSTTMEQGTDPAPIVTSVYRHYAISEPFWSPSYQMPTWR